MRGFAAYRLARYHRPNAHVLSGDGLRLFREFLPDDCCTTVHVYFPDPWWKERHRKRRIMQPQFIQDVARALRSGGRLHFWTDVDEYFEATCGLIRSESELTGPSFVDEAPAEHDMDYRTHFERRMRRNDHPVIRSYFSK